MNLLEKVDLALCLLSESGISYCYLFCCTEDTLQSVDCTSSDVVSYVCIGFHHGRKTLHQLIRHNIRVHMQPSDALCLLFDCYSVHSSVISTRMPIFFWVHFLTSVMCSIFFQLCTISALAILTSRHSLSLTILIFPCTNTIP